MIRRAAVRTGRFLLALTGAALRFVWLLPGLLLLVALWLLSSTAGSQFLLDQVSRASEGMVQIGRVERGHLLGTLELDRVEVQTPGADVRIEGLRFSWSPLALLAGRAQIETLAAQTVSVTLKETEPPAEPPEPEPFEPPTRLPVDLVLNAVSVETIELAGLEGAPERIERLAFGFRWKGSRITLERFTAETTEYGRLALEAALRLAPEAVTLERLAVAEPFAVDAQARYAYAGDFEAELGWEGARWPLVDTPEFESERGRLLVSGRAEDYRLQLDADLRHPEHEGSAELTASGSTEHLVIERLRLRALGGRAEAQGTVRWAPVLALDLDARLDRLDPALLAPEVPGRISGRVQAQGELAEGRPLRFTVDLRDSVIRGETFSLEARGGWQDERLTLERAELRKGATTLTARGAAWPTLDLNAELDSRDLGSLLPELTGRLRLEAQIKGAPELPSLTARGSGSGLGYEGLASLSALDLALVFDPKGTVRLDLDARGIEGPAVIDRVNAKLDGRVDRHRLDLGVEAPEGRVELTLNGAADLEAQRWQGLLERGRLAPEGFPALSLSEPVALTLSEPRTRLERACWRTEDGEQVGLCLAADVQPGRIEAELALERLDYGLFQPFLPEDFSLRGAVRGEARAQLIEGRVPRLSVALDTEPGAFELRNRPAIELGAGRIRLTDGETGLEADVDLPFDDGFIKLEARAEPGTDLAARALSGLLEVRLETLDWVNRLSPEFEELSGSLSAEVALAGTLGEPAVEGEAVLSLPRLVLVEPGITLLDTVAVLRARPDGEASVEGRTRSGDGELTLTGTLFIDDAAPRADLRLRGEQFLAVDIPDARVWINPNLRIQLADNRLDVSGRVTVPRADITPRGGEGSGQGPTDDQIIVREGDLPPKDGGPAIHAEVTVVLGEAVRIDGFGLTSRLQGRLTALQSPGQPASGRGEIRLVGGRFQAYGQDLEIENGRLIFAGGPLTDPALDIRAVRRPRDDITVGVFVRGRLDAPEFALFSTPPMPQDQQLGWLILGRSIAAGGEDQANVAGAALALGLSGGDFLAQRLKGGLRVDDISIGARPGEDPEQARLTIGKYLSPRLYVSYGVGLFQPGHVFRLLYDLGRGFKLQAETGVVSGADLLYTIETDGSLSRRVSRSLQSQGGDREPIRTPGPAP